MFGKWGRCTGPPSDLIAVIEKMQKQVPFRNDGSRRSGNLVNTHDFARRLYPMFEKNWELLTPHQKTDLIELFDNHSAYSIADELFILSRLDFSSKEGPHTLSGWIKAKKIIELAMPSLSTSSNQIGKTLPTPTPKIPDNPLVEATKNARITYYSNNDPFIDDENAKRYFMLLTHQTRLKDEHLELERQKKITEFKEVYGILYEEYEKIKKNYDEYKKFQNLELYHEKQQSDEIKKQVADILDYETREVFRKHCEKRRNEIDSFDIECSEKSVKRLSIEHLLTDGDVDFDYINKMDSFDKKKFFMEKIILDSGDFTPAQKNRIKDAFGKISLNKLEEEQALERLSANEKRIHYYEFFMDTSFVGGSTALTDRTKQKTEDFLEKRKAFLDFFDEFVLLDYPNSTSRTDETPTSAELKLKEIDCEQLNRYNDELRIKENKAWYKKVKGFFYRKPQAQSDDSSIDSVKEFKVLSYIVLRRLIDKEKESRAKRKLKESSRVEFELYDGQLSPSGNENKPWYKFGRFFSKKPQAQAEPDQLNIPPELKGIENGKLRRLIDKEKESRKVLDNIRLKSNEIKAVKDAFKEEMLRTHGNYSSLSLGFDETTKEELKSGSIAFKKDEKTYLFKKNDSKTRLECYTADGNILFEFATGDNRDIFTDLENNVKLKTIKEIIVKGKFSDSVMEYDGLKQYKVKKDGNQLKLFYEESEVFSSNDADLMEDFDNKHKQHEDNKKREIKDRETKIIEWVKRQIAFSTNKLKYDFETKCYYLETISRDGKLIMSDDKIEYQKGDKVDSITDEESLRAFEEKIKSHECQMKLKIERDLSLFPDLKYDFETKCYYTMTSFEKLIMKDDEIEYVSRDDKVLAARYKPIFGEVLVTKDEESIRVCKEKIREHEDFMNNKIITQIMDCKDFIYLPDRKCYKITTEDGKLVISDDEIKYQDKDGNDVYVTKDSDVLRVFKEKEKEKKESILDNLVSKQSELMYYSDDSLVMNKRYGIRKLDTGSSSILFEEVIYNGKPFGCPRINIDNCEMFEQLSFLSMIKEMRKEELVREALSNSSNSSLTMHDYKFVKSADKSLEISKKGVKLEELGREDIEMFRKHKGYLEITDDKLIIGDNIFLFRGDGDEVFHKISGSDNKIKITDLELKRRLLETKELVENKMKEAIEVDVKRQEKKFHEIDREGLEILKQKKDLEDKIREEERQMQLEIDKQTNAKIKEREDVLKEFNDASKLRLDDNGNLVSDTFIFKLNQSRIDVFKHDDKTKPFTSLDDIDGGRFKSNKDKLRAIQKTDLFGAFASRLGNEKGLFDFFGGGR